MFVRINLVMSEDCFDAVTGLRHLLPGGMGVAMSLQNSGPIPHLRGFRLREILTIISTIIYAHN
jgi:hypothetical protein